jgi:hypothetical protein
LLSFVWYDFNFAEVAEFVGAVAFFETNWKQKSQNRDYQSRQLGMDSLDLTQTTVDGASLPSVESLDVSVLTTRADDTLPEEG